MAGITGQGTTFNLPNYVGELFGLTPQDTKLLSAIGGLTGGKRATAKQFSWQTYDLRSAAQNVALEGDDAPAAQERVRAEVSNVVQVHQEAIEVSYSKLAAVGQRDGIGVAGTNPVGNENDWQVEQMLKQIARDVEYSFINGAYQNPSDNLTPRKTRGILAAITTNATDAAGALLDEDLVLDMLQDAFDNGGIQENDTRVLLANSFQKRMLTDVFITQKNYREQSRDIAGVHVTVIETDFGILNVMLNRFMPTDTIAAVSAEELAPVILEIPEKGFLFVEPLAKTGAAERSQIYGEIGLEYGAEIHHAKLTNLATSEPS